MKKLLLAFVGVLILSGCTNKEMVTYYENTKAGGAIDSYQLDLRIYGTFNEKSYSEIVRVDNYKGTQLKIDYISKNDARLNRDVIKEEVVDPTLESKEPNFEDPNGDPILDRLSEDTAIYVIDGKIYERKDGRYTEIESALYSNPNVYLETISKGSNIEFLFDEKIGEENYKVYTFKVSPTNMKPMLDDGVLKDLELKEDVSAKLWIDKDSRVYKVVYYIKDGTDKLEINASIFRINIINDMTNMVR